MTARPGLQAAPPDDGGHQGSFTRPQDVLTEPSVGDLDASSPPMHHDPVPKPKHGLSWVGILVVLACIALGLMLAAIPRVTGA